MKQWPLTALHVHGALMENLSKVKVQRVNGTNGNDWLGSHAKSSNALECLVREELNQRNFKDSLA